MIVTRCGHYLFSISAILSNTIVSFLKELRLSVLRSRFVLRSCRPMSLLIGTKRFANENRRSTQAFGSRRTDTKMSKGAGFNIGFISSLSAALAESRAIKSAHRTHWNIIDRLHFRRQNYVQGSLLYFLRYKHLFFWVLNFNRCFSKANNRSILDNLILLTMFLSCYAKQWRYTNGTCATPSWVNI